MATAAKILSLFLFLQAWSLPWLLLWSLQAFLTLAEGSLRVTSSSSVSSSTWTAFRRSSTAGVQTGVGSWRDQKNTVHCKAICQRKLSLPLYYHKTAQPSFPSENCFSFITSYFCRHYFCGQKCRLQRSVCERQMEINSHFLTCCNAHLLSKLLYFLTQSIKKVKWKRIRARGGGEYIWDWHTEMPHSSSQQSWNIPASLPQ